jgi:hypothetical protein
MKSRLAFFGLALLLASACTTQSEGQRCQTANGNDDCDNGLVCYKAAEIYLAGGQSSNADICCPVDRTQAVEDICKLSPVTPGSDASIPDTGTSDSASDTGAKDGASDAGDASTDGASSDGSADASSDAADSGG